MSRQFKWRGIIVLLVFCLALLYLSPSLSDRLPDWWGSVLPSEKIHLGLDLQGGMHLVLEVDSQAAVASTAERLSQDLRASLRDKNIPFAQVARPEEGAEIEVVFLKEEYLKPLEVLLKERFPELKIMSTTVDSGRTTAVMGIEAKAAARIRRMAVDQALQTIRNRVDEFGVSEPEIRPQGEERLLIQLPGVKDPQRAKKLIGRTAQLAFKLVDEEADVNKAVSTGVVPPGDELL
ncbi:MAG: protein translocase subunit SecD, partial [Deltaproteobacteria bacterium]|nr:protein translocase subunit SecD [Deltaproteobacteria bacterium]